MGLHVIIRRCQCARIDGYEAPRRRHSRTPKFLGRPARFHYDVRGQLASTRVFFFGDYHFYFGHKYFHISHFLASAKMREQSTDFG